MAPIWGDSRLTLLAIVWGGMFLGVGWLIDPNPSLPVMSAIFAAMAASAYPLEASLSTTVTFREEDILVRRWGWEWLGAAEAVRYADILDVDVRETFSSVTLRLVTRAGPLDLGPFPPLYGRRCRRLCVLAAQQIRERLVVGQEDGRSGRG